MGFFKTGSDKLKKPYCRATCIIIERMDSSMPSSQNTNTVTHNMTGLPFEQAVIHQFSHEVQLRQQFILMFLLEGSLQLSLDGRTHTLLTHDILFLKPREIHAVLDTSTDINVLGIFIPTDFLDTYCPDLEQISFSTHTVRCSEENPVYVSLCTSIAQMILHTIKNDSCTRMKLISSVTSILIQLIEAFGIKNVSSDDNDYLRQQISAILSYLNEHLDEKITLSSAAQVLGFHPQYFSVFFKKHFQYTFVDYVTNLRVSKSLNDLIYSDRSITEIALHHGFSSHKTYSTAFRKNYGITPSEYRRVRRFENGNAYLDDQNLEHFSYFQKYWDTDQTPASNRHALQKHMTLHLAPNAVSGKEQMPDICFSLGRASLLLRGDIQQQVREAIRELHFPALRIRDIFSDDLLVYYEDEEKHPIINWKYIDIIFDFLLDLGIKPFPEIGFMPRELASKKQYANWLFRPNVSLPKSFKKWSLLMKSFMEHLITRYGRKEVLTWNFDFWTTANLDFKDSYWQESREDFFLFYRITYFSVKNVDPDIRLGSPDFSLPVGLDWYEAFFNYCREYELHPAYISTHLYNCIDDMGPEASRLSRFSRSWDTLGPQKTSCNTTVQNIDLLYNLLKKYQLDELPLIVSDWNLSYFPRDLVRDTCFMAPHLLYNAIQTHHQVDTLCYRSLSDISEDFMIDQKLFHGGPGIMDFNGLKKASYYAFFLLHKMGRQILSFGENYLLTQSETGYQLLLFHYVYYDFLYSIDDHSSLSYTQRYNIYESSEDLVVHALLTIPEGSYTVKESRLNRQNGSVYDLWMEMGAPEDLDAEIISYLSQRNRPEIRHYTAESKGTLMLAATLPPHGVVLFELKQKQSLSLS